MAPRQQRKPAYQAPPPPRRSAVPPPANDNRAGRRGALAGTLLALLATAGYIVYRALA